MKGILWAVLQEPIAVLPIFDHGCPHHITLFFNVDKAQYQHLIGTELEATAIANIWNKDIQAIAVLMPEGIPHKPNPHISVSWREGIAPMASNELLVNDCDRIIESFTQKLKLKIEFFEFQPKTCKFCGKALANQAKGDYCKLHRHRDPRRIALSKLNKKI